jgi:glycosyltransferase involved in cell wall biosynthesis
MNTVSVVIPNYNYGRFLPEAIDSVLAQTYACKEIIVVDDGSTDDSLEVLSRYEQQGVKVVRQKNRGVGAARNAGAKSSSGDLIAFLDADDRWLPQKIEKQIGRLLTDKEFGMVTVGMREFDAGGNTLQNYTEGKEGWCAEDLLLIKPVVIGPGSTVLVWREIFDRTGGFDETKEMHPSEDWEFSYRVAKLAKLTYLPEILTEYRNHGGNGHLNIPRFERAMTMALDKVYAAPDDELKRLKTASYASLHKIMAGSCFGAGNYRMFLRHALKSARLDPANLLYFMQFPVRRLRRGWGKQPS